MTCVSCCDFYCLNACLFLYLYKLKHLDNKHHHQKKTHRMFWKTNLLCLDELLLSLSLSRCLSLLEDLWLDLCFSELLYPLWTPFTCSLLLPFTFPCEKYIYPTFYTVVNYINFLSMIKSKMFTLKNNGKYIVQYSKSNKTDA